MVVHIILWWFSVINAARQTCYQKWDAFYDQLQVKLISNEYINYIWKFEGTLAGEHLFSGVNSVI